MKAAAGAAGGGGAVGAGAGFVVSLPTTTPRFGFGPYAEETS